MKKIEKIWQYNAVFYVLSIALFLVPLYVNSNLVFPFTTGKSFLFIGLSLLAGIFYVWGQIKENKPVVGFSINGVLLLLFVIALALSSYFGVNPNHAFFGEFAGGGAMLVIAGVLFAFLLSFSIKNNKENLISFLRISTISSVLYVLGVYGGESLFKNSMDAGSLGNTSYAGAYLLIAFFIALALACISTKKWSKIVSWVAVVFIALSPILFNTSIFKGELSLKEIIANPTLLSGPANGAVFGIVVGVVTAISVFLIRSKNKIVQWGGVIVLFGLFIGLWSAGQALVNPETKLHQFYVADKNANRFVFWDIAYAGVNERPLLGWGMNAYTYVFQEKFDPVFFSPGHAVEIWTNNPHNMVAEYAVSTGYVGLVTYLLVLGSAGVALFVASRSEDKTQRVVSILFFGALVGYVIQNFFVFDTVAPMMLFFVLIGYALSTQSSYKIGIHFLLKKIALFILLLAGLVLLYMAAWLPVLEARSFVNYARNNYSVTQTKSPHYISFASYAGDASVVASKITTYYSDKLSEIIKNEESANRVMGVLEKVATDMVEIIESDGRGNFRGYWLTGQIYIKLFEFSNKKDFTMLTKGKEYLQKAAEVNPNNPELYHNLGSIALFEKDYKAAQKYIRAYIALAPEYKKGYEYADKLITGGVATKDFKEFVSTMRNRWCAADSACMNDVWKK